MADDFLLDDDGHLDYEKAILLLRPGSRRSETRTWKDHPPTHRYFGPAERWQGEGVLVEPGSIQVALTGVQTIPSSEEIGSCYACGRPILLYYPRWTGEEPWRYYHWDCAEQIPYTGADHHKLEQTRRTLAGE